MNATLTYTREELFDRIQKLSPNQMAQLARALDAVENDQPIPEKQVDVPIFSENEEKFLAEMFEKDANLFRRLAQ